MAESERIRAEVMAAAAEATAAWLALDAALGGSAAHRARRNRPLISPEFNDDDAAAPQEIISAWMRNESPEEKAYYQRARSSDFQAERRRWAIANERLHNSEFSAAFEQLRAHDPAAVEHGVAYLEADPWCFHSGYLKADLSRYLRNTPLTGTQKQRLRAAILSNLNKGNRAEFRDTRALARRLDTPEFRLALESLSAHPDPGTAERARLLLASCKMNQTRGDLRGAG